MRNDTMAVRPCLETLEDRLVPSGSSASYLWIGDHSTLFTDRLNWRVLGVVPSRAPGSDDDVTISAPMTPGCSWPEIRDPDSDGTPAVRSVVVLDGVLNLDKGAQLSVAGNLSVTTDVGSGGSIVFGAGTSSWFTTLTVGTDANASHGLYVTGTGCVFTVVNDSSINNIITGNVWFTNGGKLLMGLAHDGSATYGHLDIQGNLTFAGGIMTVDVKAAETSVCDRISATTATVNSASVVNVYTQGTPDATDHAYALIDVTEENGFVAGDGFGTINLNGYSGWVNGFSGTWWGLKSPGSGGA